MGTNFWVKMCTRVPYKDGECPMEMECYEEDLSPVQKEAYNKALKEYNEFVEKFDGEMSSVNAEILERGKYVTVYRIPQKEETKQSKVGSIRIKSTTQLLEASATDTAITPSPPVSTHQLRIRNTNSAVAGTNTLADSVRKTTITPAFASSTNTRPISNVTNVIQLSSVTITPIPNQPAVSSDNRATRQVIVRLPAGSLNNLVVHNQPILNNGNAGIRKANVRPTVQMNNNQSVGCSTGISNEATKQPSVIDLTEDDGNNRPNQISKQPSSTLQTFPSLVIVARPWMKHKDITSSVLTQERTNLDANVKETCSVAPNVFIEWLIRKGLLLCEQTCEIHRGIDNLPVQLKLARIYEKDKLPNSGGYVWIGDCCPNKYVASVFHKSLFEDVVEHCTPFVALKLIYHWVCQTSINNIINWTKVDKHIVKNFFTNLRSICTAAIWEKSGLFGGPNKEIQVSIISLGTMSHDKKSKNIKTDILGVLELETKFIRLQALEMQHRNKDNVARMREILRYMPSLVDKRSTIIIDRTVDNTVLRKLGFYSILQLGSPTKSDLMEYLKTVLPRMFQSTLQLLTDQLIQQFLDELSWRERFGITSERAFNNILTHISEQSSIKSGVGITKMLGKIYSYPFKNWKYSEWKFNDENNVNNTEEAQLASHKDSIDPSIEQVESGSCGDSVVPSIEGQLEINENPLVPSVEGQLAINENPLVPSIDMLPPSITQIDNDTSTENMTLEKSPVLNSTLTSKNASNSSKGKKRQKSNDDDDQIIKKSNTSLSSLNAIYANRDGQISLDSYFYGTLVTNVKAQSKVNIVNLGVKCCDDKYDCNLDLMGHVLEHALEEREGYSTTDVICKYCYENFKFDNQLNQHIQNVHKKSNRLTLCCLICMKTFRSRMSLIQHMEENHEELELPYSCKVCKYRTSQHAEIIDHFHDVHKGGERVLCPFCLRTVLLAANEQKMTANMSFFINHMKRHIQINKDKRCDKCQLRFTWQSDYREHYSRDHVSYAHIAGVVRKTCSLDDTMIPVPFISDKSELLKKGGQIYTSVNTNLQMTSMSLVRHECKECSGIILNDKDNHFEKYMSCLLCQYATCCLRAMKCHIANFHISKHDTKPQFVVKLESSMFCPCGFSSDSGMDIAQHLAKCDLSSTAYPSSENAASSCLRTRSTIDMNDTRQEITTRFLSSFSDPYESSGNESPPDILRSLGLRRCNPPSISSRLLNKELQQTPTTIVNSEMEGETIAQDEKDNDNSSYETTDAVGYNMEEMERTVSDETAN